MEFQFETERLRIRPWRDEDRRALERMVFDEEMMRYVTQGRTWSDADVDEFLERQARHLQQDGVCFGAVELLDSAEVIGTAGMQRLDNGDFEIGWWIWKDHWGQGLATEAMLPVVEHARTTMALDRLVAVIDPPNLASRRVAEKLGMAFECEKSARETIAKRPDQRIAYYSMSLAKGV
ncbi:GNAT family N-acetyltransferase [Wenzhouxiangella marina]|uniref:Uncharacterized protein n=1 Tax=Wenzhouxiangella marina TaxID=1579979 RepID=A0A0K0XSH6_9GAMM|nr:GNAT family N-acetyltransferase [Wenzhouxiangella marina]AKS40664.1 hypothetical protein WM2015_277 [Wenzhouxiangella marina]MBB6088434.1 RimJ/RimL family protein N-acetyltransferase [Wenzhouxiangella marina]